MLIKLVATGITLTTAFMGCLLPVYLDPGRHRGREKFFECVLSLLGCFAGGVMFGLAFAHLLPSAAAMFKEDGVPRPVFCSSAIAAASAVFILFFERMFSKQPGLIVGRGREGLACHEDDVDECERLCGPHTDSHYHQVSYSSKIFREGLESGVRLTQHVASGTGLGDAAVEVRPANDVKVTEASWTPWVLLMVMCLHSLLEGVALGSTATRGDAVVIAVAILSHKFLAGLALGAAWGRHQLPLATHCMYSAVFALMTPIGSVGGIVIRHALRGRGPLLFSAAAQAAGAGTFLHVGLKEFLYEEFDRSDNTRGTWKVLCAGTGFGAMVVLGFFL